VDTKSKLILAGKTKQELEEEEQVNLRKVEAREKAKKAKEEKAKAKAEKVAAQLAKHIAGGEEVPVGEEQEEEEEEEEVVPQADTGLEDAMSAVRIGDQVLVNASDQDAKVEYLRVMVRTVNAQLISAREYIDVLKAFIESKGFVPPEEMGILNERFDEHIATQSTQAYEQASEDEEELEDAFRAQAAALVTFEDGTHDPINTIKRQATGHPKNKEA